MKKQVFAFIKYSIYGILTTAVNFILFIFMKENGMHYIFANSLSYFIAVVMNYILNRKYVFGKGTQQVKAVIAEFMKFIFVRVAALVMDNVFFYILVERFEFHIYVTKILLSFASITVTYLVNKNYVFERTENE